MKTLLASLAVLISGCADTSTIRPASEGKSGFEGAVYAGEIVTISASSPDVEEYRIFHQGATGFVSVQTVRNDAEQCATAFCELKKLLDSGVLTQQEFEREKTKVLAEP